MAWLLFVSVEPDLHDAVGGMLPALDIGANTHTLAGFASEALIIALITLMAFRSLRLALGAGALLLSHLAADLLTSRLSLWPVGPSAGLDLYTVHWADFALEAAVIVIGLALYATSPDLRRPPRASLLAMCAVMLVLQAVWDFGIGAA
ncbi:MAG: hypothetical protein ABI379_01435 [Rhodanobacter sp.]